jgi:hypothetical protein
LCVFPNPEKNKSKVGKRGKSITIFLRELKSKARAGNADVRSRRSTVKPKSGQADKIYSSLQKEMTFYEAACTLPPNWKMLLGVLFNNSTNVNAKWKKFFYG